MSSTRAGIVVCALLGLVDTRGAGDGNDFPLPRLEAGKLYGVTVAIDPLYRLPGAAEIEASISDPRGVVATKVLHAGDLDFYLTLRPRASGNGSVRLNRRAGGKGIGVAVDCRPMTTSPPGTRGTVAIAALPNSTWQEAAEVELGQTIVGTNDERAFIPAPSEDAYRALVKGFQWFRFTCRTAAPKLAYFGVDVADREVPVDIEVFQKGKDAAGRDDVVPSTEGQFAYVPEATQNFPGLYRFRTRIVKPGETYYLRLAANHPLYRVRTTLYDPPPYRDARQAVRAGMDFLINLGDSWHANTPRRGSTALRSAMPHAETQLCIACHPTQFTTRGYLTAVANGYPVTQRPSLKFLIERLYNNPRPLYGLRDANWVRVIYSARTVASRIPTILDLFEREVSREAPRPGLDLGYATFLRAHYDGVEKLPGDEADGCAPSISPMEIALQSYETFDRVARLGGDTSWLEERDRVEKLLVEASVENVIDLAWKIAALARIDRERHRPEIGPLVARLYDLQRENGEWGYRFDAKSKESDFITFHALYALALAGERPETNPRMARTVEFCLRTQRHDGSWQGDPVYKGFNTPFRDTQFAVMALSQLYPGPGGKGWGAAFPAPPSELDPEVTDRFIEGADAWWELPPEPVLETLRRAAASAEQPLVRASALEALGRVADPRGVEPAIASLGAPTKVVATAAAWALREIASRRGIGRRELERALTSSNDRTRWGAARVFNQHFRELTRDVPLMDALARALDDPVAQVRAQAAGGLWRWYYWQIDNVGRRGRILEALTARMGREDVPLVRRALVESLYDALDENTGYLRAWVKAAAAPEARTQIDDGYQEVVRQQSQILARALRQGNALGREGILTSLWDFHTRHMALPEKTSFQINLPAVFTQYVPGVPDLHRPGYDYAPYRDAAGFRYDVSNGFQQTRIGNDSELIHFFPSSGPELETALLACLEGADAAGKINVLKAGHTLSEAGGPRFARAVLQLSQDADPKVREAVRYVYERGGRGIINLESGDAAPDRALVEAAVAALGGGEEGLAVVLPLLAGFEQGSPWLREAKVASALRKLVESAADRPFYPDALRAASAYPELVRDPIVQARLAESLRARPAEVRRAAVEVVLRRCLGEAALRTTVRGWLGSLDGAGRGLVIAELAAPPKPTYRGRAASATGLDVAFLKLDDIKKGKDLLADPLILDLLAEALRDRDANVRAAALDLVAKRKETRSHAAIAAALAPLGADPAPRLQRLARALLEGKESEAAFSERDPASLLDFDFFVQKVQPIFVHRGADGAACVVCHESHVILRLQPPDYNEQFSEGRSRENFRYATGVVNLAEPEKSLLLVKPTRPTDSAGDVSDYLATHNGGERWPGNEKSAEYQTILSWIRGARLAAASGAPK